MMGFMAVEIDFCGFSGGMYRTVCIVGTPFTFLSIAHRSIIDQLEEISGASDK